MFRILLLFFVLALNGFCFAQRYELNKKDTSEVHWMNGKKFYGIKVEKGETEYSICKRFNVTQDELLQNNPELKSGLKVKMKLLIPAAHTIALPSTKEKAEEKKPVKKQFNIAVMLPVKIWKSFIPDSLRSDSALLINKAGRDTMHSSTNNTPSPDEETISQMEFYEGVEYAIDTLAAKDCKFHLTFFDTENDLSRVKTYLKDTLVMKSDYIIANGNAEVLKELNHFSVDHHIPLVTFSLNASDILKNNPFGYSFTPSSALQCIETGKFFAAKYKNANAVVIKSAVTKENERGQAFAIGWDMGAEQKAKTADYSKDDFKVVVNALMKTKSNIVFIPSSNEDYVNSLITQLNDTTNTYSITVVGIPTWQYFESMDPKVLENVNTHLFTASGNDPEETKTVSFRKSFRNLYITEPEESAYQGYDAMMFIGRICKGLSKKEDEKHFEGLYSSYDFIIENGTNENQKIHILKYNNYSLIEVK